MNLFTFFNDLSIYLLVPGRGGRAEVRRRAFLPPAQSRKSVKSRERVIDFLYWQPTGPNPLDHRDDFSRPALRHGSSNSLFQVA